MKVLKKTVSGVTAFNFGSKCFKFLVKNFTSGDITVSFSEKMPEGETATIKAGMGQVVVDNEYLGGLPPYLHNAIYISGNGEVEVQALCHR